MCPRVISTRSLSTVERANMKLAQSSKRKNPKPFSSPKPFCEFFAGIGLVREGLTPGGWHCIYANDIDPKKKHVYDARFGKPAHFHLGDVFQTHEALDRIPGTPFLATA